MHFLFIIDPIEHLKAYKDSSVAMMQALVEKGCQLSIAQPADLFVRDGIVYGHTQTLSLIADADLHQPHWYRITSEQTVALSTFTGVIMRKDPPFDMEFYYTTHLLTCAQRNGTRVFNTGSALREHPEKLAITEFPQYCVPTLISRSMTDLRAFYHEQGDVVAKPLDGMGGMGIFRIKPNDANLGSILELLTQQGQQTIMMQKFIPSITQGDKRILIINGQPIPYVLARIPAQGENRGNLAAGGHGVVQPISDHDKAMATTIGQTLVKRGLFLIGLDVIGEHITEINVTSPTCFVEITQGSDFHVARHFVEQLLLVCKDVA